MRLSGFAMRLRRRRRRKLMNSPEANTEEEEKKSVLEQERMKLNNGRDKASFLLR